MSNQRWLRKTVIIGLGGTGRDVVLNVKRKYREVYGTDDVPATRFLVFDTADPKPLILPGGSQIELSPGEFFKMSVNSPGLAVQVNEEIQKWFPERDIPMTSVHRGASQVRALGRLALYGNAREIYSRIKRAIDGVNSILPHEDLGRFRVSGDSVLVNVVSSLSGGTGSGTLLDVAYVCREHMRSATDVLTAYLLLPDIFTPLTATENVEGNAYAALSELDYLTSQAKFDQKERSFSFGGRDLSMQQPPFDTIYLVNNRNQRGQVYETVPELTELIGLGIFVATGAPGKEAGDVWDNLQHQIPAPIQGKRPFYASFGVSELALDIAGREERDARRIAAETVKSLFLGEAATGADDADSFLREEGLSSDLPAKLLTGSVVPVDGGEVRPDMLSRFVNSVRDQALARIADLERNHPYPDEWEAERVARLAQHCTHLLAQASGVGRAAAFVDTLVTTLRERIDLVEAEAASHRQALEQTRARYEGLQRSAQEAVKKWWPWRLKASSTVAKNFAAAVNSEARNSFEVKGMERAARALAALWKAGREHQQVLHAMRDVARTVAPTLAPVAEAAREPEPFTIRLPCPEPRHDHVSLDAGSFLAWLSRRRETVQDLALLSPAQFRAVMLEFGASQPGAALASTVTVTEALESCPEPEQRRYLQALDALASPLWEYEPAYLPAGRRTQTIQILGVPDTDTKLDKLLPHSLQTGRAIQQVMTNDPHRIYCYKVEAAIPAFMLSGARRYQARFHSLGDDIVFHAGKDFESVPEIIPDPAGTSSAPDTGNGRPADFPFAIPVVDPLGERARNGAGADERPAVSRTPDDPARDAAPARQPDPSPAAAAEETTSPAGEGAGGAEAV